MSYENVEKKLDANNFPHMIHDIVRIRKCSYMDAIVDFCKDNSIEEEVAASFIDKSIRDRIEREGQSLRMLPKTKGLPIGKRNSETP